MKVQRIRFIHKIPFLIISLIMGTGYFLSGCTQKDLTYDQNPIKVSVEFNWDNAINANPEGMTVLFFPADADSQSWRFDLDGREGGEVEVLPGTYNVLTFDNDLPGIEFTNTDDFYRFSATSRRINDTISAPTGMLYAANRTSERIFNTYGKPHIITLAPDSLATVYHIRLDSVSGTERIKTATALIKGVARSVSLQLERNSKQTGCISAPLNIDPDCNSRLLALTTAFGNPDLQDPKIGLEIIVTTSHGKYSKSFDVTDQVVNSKHPRDVYIIIKGLDIPAADNPTDPAGNPDVGIAVGVDGWQLIEIIYS